MKHASEIRQRFLEERGSSARVRKTIINGNQENGCIVAPAGSLGRSEPTNHERGRVLFSLLAGTTGSFLESVGLDASRTHSLSEA